MKIFSILRGFPGLGRVIAGVEILETLKRQYNYDFKIVSYLQGEKYINSKNINSEIQVKQQDISSIGIIPVSNSGEQIISAIKKDKSDLILIDGEPLLNILIKDFFPQIRIVNILNPFDVENPHNQASSQLFFQKAFSNADLSIIHGLWNVKKVKCLKNYISVQNIIRKSITEIKPNILSNKIVCILGGGTETINSMFLKDSIEIGFKIIHIANLHKSLKFHIYTSSKKITNELEQNTNLSSNVFIYEKIFDFKHLYKNTKIVIARAGRNTIGELLNLNIPSIIIPTRSKYRGSEQLSNSEFVKSIKSNIKTFYLDQNIIKFERLFNDILNNCDTQIKYEMNNSIEIVVEQIINLTKKQKKLYH